MDEFGFEEVCEVIFLKDRYWLMNSGNGSVSMTICEFNKSVCEFGFLFDNSNFSPLTRDGEINVEKRLQFAAVCEKFDT